ncbi:MAG: hypothetical protein F4X60_16230 [Gemmatimonadetes bacterium]|nr:hypothetical protein [Gemmatimonadota bacterium]MYC00080.1 hypothetical protein [Gemmatimonadota bacterium]
MRRVAATCLALLHLGSASALTHAYALLDAASMGLADHVESPDGSDCAVHHGHFFCQVVRSQLEADVPLGVTVEAELAPPIRVVETHREGDDARSPPILLGAVSPRGPPV